MARNEPTPQRLGIELETAAFLATDNLASLRRRCAEQPHLLDDTVSAAVNTGAAKTIATFANVLQETGMDPQLIRRVVNQVRSTPPSELQ